MLKTAIKRTYLRFKLRKKNVKFARNSRISLKSKFEGCNRIGENVFFSGKLGYGTYIGEESKIQANVGRFCSIAAHVITVRGTHPTQKWASSHPAFFSTEKQCGKTFVSYEKFSENKPLLEVGNDVWIGDSAIIMDGISIGDGAIIAAGAVVTKDVAPYTVVGGVPAKEIRKRFSQELIERLERAKWWEKPISWLEDHAGLFEDAEILLKHLESEGGALHNDESL